MIKRIFALSVIGFMLACPFPHAASAQSVPASMSFQGRLAKPDGTPVADTPSQSLTFRLYSAAFGGTLLWSQTANVVVRNGTFAAPLDFSKGYVGQTLAGVFNGSPVYLEVQVGSDTPLNPRQLLTSNAYAFTALNALGVAAGSIGLSQLAAGVLNFANLSGTINPNQIASGSITGSMIANGTLTAAKFTRGVLTPGGNAGGDLTGTYPNPSLITDVSLLPKVSGNVLTVALSETPDQSQLVTQVIISQLTSIWQSFTAGQNGVLNGLDVRLGTESGSAATATLNLYAGVGTGGTLLYTTPISVNGVISMQHFDLTGTLHALVVGRVYTFSVVAPGGVTFAIGENNSNPYPGGRSSFGAIYDLVFQTYYGINNALALHGSLNIDDGITTHAPGTFTLNVNGTANLTGNAGIGGKLALNSNELRLRDVADANHTLSYQSTWNGVNVDGPVLTGYGGGILGLNRNGTLSSVLNWNDSGNVGIGTTAPAYKLDVNGQVRASNVSVTSDARYKTNIATFPNALDTVLGLRGVTFDWNRDRWQEKNFASGRQVGFIAQEVESVLPELVTTDASGYKSVAYQNVVPVLVEAVKTLKKDNEALRRQKDAEISELRAENAAMKARLDAIEKLLLRNRKP